MKKTFLIITAMFPMTMYCFSQGALQTKASPVIQKNLSTKVSAIKTNVNTSNQGNTDNTAASLSDEYFSVRPMKQAKLQTSIGHVLCLIKIINKLQASRITTRMNIRRALKYPTLKCKTRMPQHLTIFQKVGDFTSLSSQEVMRVGRLVF